MKKNNKGFFLAEVIVMIALVTTVMAFVYPNITKLYENYVNKTRYYDQTQDIYTLRAVYDYLSSGNTIRNKVYNNEGDKITLNRINGNSEITNPPEIGDLSKLYILQYMATPEDNTDYDFTRYLKRMKRTTYDDVSYRLVGVFEKTDEDGNTETRYASIKIPDPGLY
jgi:hypothetical protein